MLKHRWASGINGVLSAALLGIFFGCSNTNKNTAIPAPPPAVVTSQNATPANVDPAEVERQLLIKVNDERGDQKLPPLTQDPALQGRARDHSREMAEKGQLNAIAPSTEEMSSRMQSTGAKTEAVGENVLRLDSRAKDVSDQVVRSWLGMNADRQNLLSPKFSQTGIGVERASDGRLYITEDFAS